MAGDSNLISFDHEDDYVEDDYFEDDYFEDHHVEDNNSFRIFEEQISHPGTALASQVGLGKEESQQALKGMPSYDYEDNYIPDEDDEEAADESVRLPESNFVLKTEFSKEERDQAAIFQLRDTVDNLHDIANSEDIDDNLREFAEITVQIIEHWQRRAGDKNPTQFPIDFGDKNTATLLQVLALVPENVQDYILVQDPARSPSRNGYDLSWLDEHIMNVIVRLWGFRKDGGVVQFGRDLASGVSTTMDAFYLNEHKNSFLKYRMNDWASGAPDTDWNPEGQYTFSSDVEKIVYFWNYNENHWTVVEIDLAKNQNHWTKTLYNSMENGGGNQMRGPSWNSAVEQGEHLDTLIRAASGIVKPPRPPVWNVGVSTLQTNSFDCGVIALYNAIQLLEGRDTSSLIDPNRFRNRCLASILKRLEAQEAQSSFGCGNSGYNDGNNGNGNHGEGGSVIESKSYYRPTHSSNSHAMSSSSWRRTS